MLRKTAICAVLAVMLILPAVPPARAESYASTVRELRESIDYHIRLGESGFSVNCSAELGNRLMEGRLFYDLLSWCGIFDCELKYIPYRNMMTFKFKDVVCYPSVRMLWAWRHDNRSLLTPRERETLDTAVSLLPADGTDLERERAIHDTLCRWITYDTVRSAGLSDTDTAVGALLDRRADCDGFSDAFVLLCGMCGIEARLVVNDGHAWNAVLLDGEWLMVDVTWDAGTLVSPVKVSHRYLNLTPAEMAADHEWDAEAYGIAP